MRWGEQQRRGHRASRLHVDGLERRQLGDRRVGQQREWQRHDDAVGRRQPRSSRSGTATVAGQTITINQAATLCQWSIKPTSAGAKGNGDDGTVGVTAGSGCPWTATSDVPWITVTSGASGSGNGTVAYTVARNTTNTARTGTITIAGQTFTVNQAK